MPNKSKDELAFELIDMTSWALKELYGARIPKKWKDRMRNKMEMSKTNEKLPNSNIFNINIAYKMLMHRGLIKAYKNKPLNMDIKKPIGITKFAEDLAEENGLNSSSDVFKIEKTHKQYVAYHALKKDSGSPFGYYEPISDQIEKWIEQGIKLNILRSETQNPYLYKLLTETNLLKNNVTSKKRSNHTSEQH